MSSDSPSDSSKPLAKTATAAPYVIRSSVPPGKPYQEYEEYLRYDFFYSCAYCTMTEAEAMAVRFAIDHYEPRRARPDLVDEYTNLMYSCDECNTRKSDRCPPPEARARSYRFFRPDEDVFDDHFEESSRRLSHKSNTGYYSIQALDLNRLSLRRIREIRERLSKCHELVSAGVLALRKFHIDQLPQNVRGGAARNIADAARAAERIGNDIDLLLRDYARSPLKDADPDGAKRTQERLAELKRLEALHPGRWRAPRSSEKS